MKVQHKIILAFMALTGIIFLLSCFLIYNVSAWQRNQDFRKRLTNRAITTASLLFEVEEISGDILKKVDSVTVNALYDESILIFNHEDKLLYRSGKGKHEGFMPDTNFLKKAHGSGTSFFSAGKKESVAFSYAAKQGEVIVFVAAEDKDGRNRLSQLLLLLVITFGTAVILSAFAGWIFSRRILRPLDKISHTVKTISAENIEERLPDSGVNDEWNELTKTFNLLLSRLQQSFEMQGRFIANASHELATPLTVVGSQIDVTLQQERTAEHYREILVSIKEDVDNLSHLAKSLLEIARTAKGGSLQTSFIRIDELLLDVAASLTKFTPSCKIDLQTDEFPDNVADCTVNGNYDLLFSAFKNIVENGCKYSVDNTVSVNIAFVSKKIVLLFKNKGHFDVSDTNYLFHPFFRSESAFRQKGYGIGLSLAQRIIQLHKGEIKAENLGADEVLFTVLLPATY
jgi:signal transduction histidine kinase